MNPALVGGIRGCAGAKSCNGRVVREDSGSQPPSPGAVNFRRCACGSVHPALRTWRRSWSSGFLLIPSLGVVPSSYQSKSRHAAGSISFPRSIRHTGPSTGTPVVWPGDLAVTSMAIRTCPESNLPFRIHGVLHTGSVRHHAGTCAGRNRLSARAGGAESDSSAGEERPIHFQLHQVRCCGRCQ